MRTQPTERAEVKTNRNIPFFDLNHITGICEHESEQKSKRKFVKVGEKQKRA